MTMQSVEVPCGDCGKNKSFIVNDADLIAWHEGKHIQDAMPYLTAEQREMLISDTCQECWDKMFLLFDEIGA